jgi:hypothetical protein
MDKCVVRQPIKATENDEIIGYEPKNSDPGKNQNSTTTTAKNPGSGKNEVEMASENQPNFSSYFGVISKLVTDKGTRIEFFEFLKSKLKPNKNS